MLLSDAQFVLNQSNYAEFYRLLKTIRAILEGLLEDDHAVTLLKSTEFEGQIKAVIKQYTHILSHLDRNLNLIKEEQEEISNSLSKMGGLRNAYGKPGSDKKSSLSVLA